ncbi:DUF4834 family protein [Tenacibaculum pacificus]|uniref:DUF4834 family protein n=1 Tax=Tenacibaculum pacificus TaxID=3018314 RepID=UPI0022F3BA81|nr:DUF4834 family protein [Tenacibaculum pacificus]WBX74305.1 DUF4834 family protein [Tenacibaculum pacificus]
MTHINEAGPMGFLRTILILVIAYYAIKFLVKLFAPYLLKKAVDKVQKKAEQKFNNQQQQQQQSDVEIGKTVVDKKPQNIQQSNNSVGEYVDFEEID